MDEQDGEDTIDSLKQTDEWVIWKSKDKFSNCLQAAGFHQLLHIHQDIQDECWGFKINGWCRTGDIRVKKQENLRVLGKKQSRGTIGRTGDHHHGTTGAQS